MAEPASKGEAKISGSAEGAEVVFGFHFACFGPIENADSRALFATSLLAAWFS
jgi:hypothetical protein